MTSSVPNTVVYRGNLGICFFNYKDNNFGTDVFMVDVPLCVLGVRVGLERRGLGEGGHDQSTS